jgi:hypothetical protein
VAAGEIRRSRAATSTAHPAQGAGSSWVWATSGVTVLILALFALFGARTTHGPETGLVLLLFVGSSVHVAATGWLYTLPDVRAHARRHRARYVVVPLALVSVGAVVGASLPPPALRPLLLGFFAWQFFHFTKQNLGVVALSASALHAGPLARRERRCLELAGFCGIAALVARPGLLQLQVTSWVPGLFLLAAVSYVAVVAVGLALLWRRRRSCPAGFAAAFVVALLFSAPIFIFASPYAAVGGMTVAHGIGYLLLMGMVARGEGRMNGRPVGLGLLLNVAVVGGAVLAEVSHLHGGPALERLLFGAYLGVVMSHFVIDAGIWRLRDPFPRAFLSARLPDLVASTAQHRPTIDRQPI